MPKDVVIPVATAGGMMYIRRQLNGDENMEIGKKSTSAAVKSMAEHLQSIEDMARFSFFYAARYLKRGMLQNETLADCIFEHTPLMFHGLEFRDKEKFAEIPLCCELNDAVRRFSELEPAEFEKSVWSQCGSAIRERAGELYGKSRGIGTPASWNCGSLKYDLPDAENPRLCRFHIYNTVAPNSLFADPEYLILCFKLMMKECSLRFGADTLITSTWLNERSRWLDFFPEEFHASLTPRHPDKAPGKTVGSWGFLYDARGCMNMKYINQVRENGVLPFLSRTGRCSFAAMWDHLESLPELLAKIPRWNPRLSDKGGDF